MARRLFLPVASGNAAQPPTVEAVRKRLGGRASTEPGAGEIVSLRDALGDRLGVVIFVRGDDLDVWMDGDVVRRVRRPDARPPASTIPRSVLTTAADARVFASLHEGDRISFQHDAGPGEGVLVEKCRFGALVERADGTVLGVGFRRLSPHAKKDPSSLVS